MKLFSNPELLGRYLEEHSTEEDPVLAELSRHTYLREAYPRMLSGRVLGGFLTLFSRLVQPAKILEIGTFTGYSAICLARGLAKGGTLTTIEVNDELREIALGFFKKAGLEEVIDLKTGDAKKILPGLKDRFDLVFIDAHKEDYPEYYRLLRDKVTPGGFILADNVLWGGEVMDGTSNDPATSAIRKFNTMVAADPSVENLMLPVRDGLMIIRRI